MALFKILRGPSDNLENLSLKDGYCYFTPDTGLFYIDYQKDNMTETKRIPLNAKEAISAEGIIDQNTGDIIKLWYGSTVEYEAIEKDESTIYILSDGEGGGSVADGEFVTIDEMNAAIESAIQTIPTPDMSEYYTKVEVDSLVLITPEDIDTICSTTTKVDVVTLSEGVF